MQYINKKKMSDDKKVKGVSVERQREADKLQCEIADVVNYIAEELVKIWELWGSVKGWYYFETTYDSITFMEEGCGGDRPSSPDYLFSGDILPRLKFVGFQRQNQLWS